MTKLETKKLDKKWSEKVKERDNHQCQICRATERVNSHHIEGRRNRTLRWDLENGITLCPKHHTFSSEMSAHQTPLRFHEWFREQFPERHKHLLENKNTISKLFYEDVDKSLDIGENGT